MSIKKFRLNKISIFILLFFFSIFTGNSEIISETSRIPPIIIKLIPGNFYFIGHDTGWIGKSQADNGIMHQARFYLDSKDNENEYILEIEKKDLTDNSTLFAYEFSFSIYRVLSGNKVFPKVFSGRFRDQLLKDGPNRPYTDKPYVPFEVKETLSIEKYSTLKVDLFPYVKINNYTLSLIIARSEDKKELASFIKIPEAFVFYKWNFENISVSTEVETKPKGVGSASIK